MTYHTHLNIKRFSADYFAVAAVGLLLAACGSTVNVFADEKQKEDGGTANQTQCGNDATDGASSSSSRSNSSKTTCKATSQPLEKRIKNVDILFVVDKTRSMMQERAKLAQEMPKLIKVLITGDRDGDGVSELTPAESLHLGVVTSDMGAPGISPSDSLDPQTCVGQGDDGILQHIGYPAVDPRCQGSYPEPYITHVAGVDDPDKTVTDYACMLQVDSNGCGFEQPLEAALKALWPSKDHSIAFLGDTQGHGDLENKGFLRDDSLLAVVVVTDEDDCSVGAQGNADLFVSAKSPLLPEFLKTDPNKGNKVNMRCALDDELSLKERNRWSVERYLKGFRALRPNMENRVIFGVIAGIPVDLVDQNADIPQAILGDSEADPAEVSKYYTAILDDPRMVNTEEAGDIPTSSMLTPACILANPNYDPTAEQSETNVWFVTSAEPARRFVELAKAFGVNSAVQSICETTFTSPIDRLALILATRITKSATGEN